MANTIQIKRGTGSSVPSSLAEGELAINLDSGKLFYGSGSSVLSDFKVDTLTAETYVVSSSVTHMTTSFSSGSTAFGDSAGDTHTFTGDITASGDISSSGTITALALDINGVAANTIDISSGEGNVAINASSTDADCMIRVQDNSTAGTNAMGIVATSDDFVIRNDEGNFKVKMANNATTTLDLNQSGDLFLTGEITASGNISSSGTITGNSLVGTLGTAAQTNITSVGTLGSLTVDNLNLNSNTISSTADGDVYMVLANNGISFEANSGDKFLFNVSNANNVDFQVSGENDQNLIYADASTDNVGIGDATPTAKLDVAGDINTTSHITASGHISSSANIYATDYFDNGTNISSIYQPTLTFGIADTNVLRANANVADNDFLRVDGTSIEGRTAAQVRSDIGAASTDALVAQTSPTDGAFLIADDGRSMVDSVLSQAGTVVSSTGHISSSTNIYAADYFDNGTNISSIYSPIASPTFTGTIAIPNIANVETAIAANTAKATNVSTNLTATTHASQITINSSDGNDVVIAEASDTIAGLMTTTHHDKLDAIEASATADQTQADINGLAITTVGALGSGTIASGFGNIDNGTSTLDTGEITATSIKHSISGNNAGDYGPGAEILYGISSETTTAGGIYTLRSGVWTLIDANTDNRVDRLCAVAVGTNSSTHGMLIRGCVTLASAFTAGTDVEGVQVYASETAGQATITAPSDSGDLVRILGYSLNVSAKKMFFNPDSTFLEIA